ncbi:MAG: alpha/beta fold hydrolase [Brevundimonas sp.]|nr:alpha/beta fold hydrolase [Brevundimonas sp.]
MIQLVPTLAAMAVAVAPVSATAQAASPQLVGAWEGRVALGGQSIRVVFRIAGDGSALMDSPDQGAIGIPAESPVVEGGVVRIGVPTIGGRFEGALSEDGQTLTGALHQGGASLPLVLERQAAAAAPAALVRPQTPQPPFPYSEEEVAFDAGEGVRLAGTLTRPAGEGPFPAVLLITGSGAQDRDETVFGHKPFLVLADALARRGVAVLRLDDRGVGGSTGPLEDATTADFAGDSAAALGWLAARPGIDPARLGLIGHSEGGTIAPLVAADASAPDPAFMVLMAGPAVPGGEVLTEQSRRFQTAQGLAPAVIDANVAVQARLMQAVAANAGDKAAAAEAVRAVLTEAGAPAAAVEQGVQQTTSAWVRWFVAHDPRPSLAAVDVPVLALYGGKDFQVPADQNAEALRATLPGAEIVVLPELNHLMQTADTGLTDEYARIEETIAPAALEAIVDWVVARAGL